MHSQLLHIVQDMVLRGPLRAEDVAAAVGKPYSTLMRELNPYDTGAKLGAETLLDIMKVTGDLSPLKYLADHLDCLLLPGARPLGTQPQSAPAMRASC